MSTPAERVMVTGAAGHLGRTLVRPSGAAAIGITRADIDWVRLPAVEQLFERHAPTTVIHCAAYTHVDRAETEPEMRDRVNAESVERLATDCNRLAAKLIYLSTDYVFDGNQALTPISEHVVPVPRGVYARSKYAGEQAAGQAELRPELR